MPRPTSCSARDAGPKDDRTQPCSNSRTVATCPRPPRQSAVAVRVRRSVATLESDLVNAQATELVAVREEALIDAKPAVRVCIELGHPGADAVGVELVVPRPVERVGQVHPPSVATDFDHLRPA